MTELRTIVVEPTTGDGVKLAEWKRTAFHDETTGRIYMPAEPLLGNETAAVMMAAYDGVPMVMDKGHTYLPTDWLKKELPDDTANIEACETIIRQYVAANP